MIYNTFVPNEGPLDARVFVVGESPGEDEEIQLRPFIGQAGTLLRDVLRRNGLSESSIRFCNLSNYRPQGNDFSKLDGSKQLQEGVDRLYKEISRAQPNLVIALGANPLWYLTGKTSITKFRGSIIHTTPMSWGVIKCIPTYHPSAVLRNGEYYPLFDLDLKRCGEDQHFSEARYPKREYIIAPEGFELVKWTQELYKSDRLAIDIESVKDSSHILCVGFAPNPLRGICIPYTTSANISAINKILESPAKKIFHYGTYDIEQLRINGHKVNNYWWDTIIAQHVLNPELPRGLDFLASVYTREPYYKTEGRGEIPGDTKAWSNKADKNSLYVYNCKDICVTAEIQAKQELELDDNDRRIFDFELSLQAAAFEIMQNGLLVDQERRNLIRKACIIKWAKYQTIIDGLAGRKINVNSPKQIKSLLYDELKLPIKRKRGGGVTADEDALVASITFVKGKLNDLKTDKAKADWERKLGILKCIIGIRGLRKTLSSYILFKESSDGRVRSMVSVAATETGRWSMSKYVDGTGVNSQTFPRDSVEVPDDMPDIPQDLSEVEKGIISLLEEEDDTES